MYGAIKTTARGTMGHAVADKRVYCHEALHLKAKLQTAGCKQVVEKWDTDSDSDLELPNVNFSSKCWVSVH